MFRHRPASLLIAAFCIALSSAQGLIAQSRPATGAITGTADPGAQIVVTNVEDGQVIGIVAKCDGSYRADGLRPGRYEIVEGGQHHAIRKLSVAEGQDSHVDLAAEVKSQCASK